MLRAEAGLRAAAILQEAGQASQAQAALTNALALAGDDQSMQVSIVLSQAALAEDANNYHSHRELPPSPDPDYHHAKCVASILSAALASPASLLAQNDPVKSTKLSPLWERLSNNKEPGTEPFSAWSA